MKEFGEIKKEICDINISSAKESKYGKFLDKLVSPDYDRRREDGDWDLWYFSDNTEFCKKSARYYLEEIEKQFNEHKKLRRDLDDDEALARNEFRFERLRRIFGCFSFYLYASLESFAHEINIFYELKMDRRKVSIKEMEKLLKIRRENSSLLPHLERFLSHIDVQTFRNYRDAIMHGYVFPISGHGDELFIKENPKYTPFSFEHSGLNLLGFCKKSYSEVDSFICRGWRCFENDELSTSNSEK